MTRSLVRGPTLEVRTPEHLRGLGRRGRPIALVGWPAHARARLESRLTEWATACGCDTGAALMLLATAAAVGAVVLDLASRGIASAGFGHLATVVVAVIAGAIVGKAAGLAWAEV